MARWLPSSLSSRIIAVFVITAIAAVLLMASLFSRGLGSQWQRGIAPHLVQYVAYIRDDLGSPPDEQRAIALTQRLPIQIQVHDKASGSLLFTTDNKIITIEKIRFHDTQRWQARAKNQLSDEHKASRSEHDSNSSSKILTNTAVEDIAIGDNRQSPILRLGLENHSVYIKFKRPGGRGQGLDELLWAIAGLALLLGLCYFAIKHLLKPIGSLQDAVQRISSGDFTARTNVAGSNDLAVLAQSVDSMSGRIQQMLDAKRELLLAISHELRSPLTRARVAAELLEPSRHQHKLICDIDEMEKLIARLVESERLQTHAVLTLKDVDIGQLVTQSVNSFDAEIIWSAPHSPVILHADESRVLVLLRNLIENALKHGSPSPETPATVQIALNNAESEITLTIRDNGPGIESQHLSSVTEPFYRPDGSRTRKTGGFGLGLHLCKRIVEAHGGKLLIESSADDNAGVCVTVILPKGLTSSER